MGYIVRYLRACSDDALDRVLTAQDWRAMRCNEDGRRCLVGHAEDVEPEPRAVSVYDRVVARMGVDGWDKVREAPFVFDRLARRFGLPRAVQLVKQRAAMVLDSRYPTPPIASRPPARREVGQPQGT